MIIADPERFMRVFVVEMASPLLLGDAVKALRTAASADAKTAEEGEGVHTTSSEEIVDPFEAIRALREVVMPGAVQRLTKVSKTLVLMYRLSLACDPYTVCGMIDFALFLLPIYRVWYDRSCIPRYRTRDLAVVGADWQYCQLTLQNN